MRVTLIRQDHLVFWACDACKTVGAYSVRKNDSARLTQDTAAFAVCSIE